MAHKDWRVVPENVTVSCVTCSFLPFGSVKRRLQEGVRDADAFSSSSTGGLHSRKAQQRVKQRDARCVLEVTLLSDAKPLVRDNANRDTHGAIQVPKPLVASAGQHYLIARGGTRWHCDVQGCLLSRKA